MTRKTITKAEQYPCRVTVPMDYETKEALDKFSRDFSCTVQRKNERITPNWMIRALIQPKILKAILNRLNAEKCVNEAAFKREVESVLFGGET